jgi:hypothetical protein
MLAPNDKNWRQLCSAALEAKDSDELLEIVQKLNNALECEERLDRNQRKTSTGKTSGEPQC